MASIRFEEFDAAKPHTFESYIERLDCVFASRDTEESKKGPTLLSVVGADTYQIARNLCSPGAAIDQVLRGTEDATAGIFQAQG